jgi:hypothetical protein
MGIDVRLIKWRYGGAEWIHVAQDRVQCGRDLVKTIMYNWIPYKAGLP